MQSAQFDEQKVLKHFRDRTKKSSELFQKALKVSPGGVMAGIKFFEPYPVFMEKAAGSHVWDVDGNEYVDFLMSYGALILGHGVSVAKAAISSTLDAVGTTVMGTPTGVEVEYGATLRDIFHPGGLMRFTNSGLEATLLSVRLARAYTGRRKIAKFEGHYHGAVDHLLFSYTPPNQGAGSGTSPVPIGDSAEVDGGMLADSVVLPFNDWESTERALSERSKEIACVIMEPFEEGVIPAEPKFMKDLRRLTRDLGIPLIFDEVKTGFRVRLGGATEFYSVMPDIACLGKIIGGGLPIGAVVGEAEVLGLLGPQGGRPKVFHSGTFNGNPLSLTVGQATVEELSKRGRFETLANRTGALKRALSAELSKRGLRHVVAGEGGMFNYYLTETGVKNYRDTRAADLRTRRLLDLEMISRGVYLKPENRFCLSLAHSSDDVELTRQRFAESLDSSTSDAS